MAEPQTDHEIDVDVDDVDSAAMAAMMGFSSFGSQAHPNKKRRFNPLADAVIDSPYNNRPPAAGGARAGHSSRPPTTSANSVPVAPRAPMTLPPPSSTLPARPPAPSAPLPQKPVASISNLPLLPVPTKSNSDEINLDDDEDVEGQQGENGDAQPGPQYIDTSRPIGEVRDHGSNDYSGGPLPGAEDVSAQPDPEQLDGSVLSTGHFGHHAEGGRLKDRHGFRPDLAPDGADSALVGVDGEVDTNTNTGSEPRQRDWWTGYYDPQSNENPWKQIEAKLELPPRPGCWLKAGHHKGQLGPGGGGGNHRGGGGGRGGFRGRGFSNSRGRGPRRY